MPFIKMSQSSISDHNIQSILSNITGIANVQMDKSIDSTASNNKSVPQPKIKFIQRQEKKSMSRKNQFLNGFSWSKNGENKASISRNHSNNTDCHLNDIAYNGLCRFFFVARQLTLISDTFQPCLRIEKEQT
jgi:hypothetical protein